MHLSAIHAENHHCSTLRVASSLRASSSCSLCGLAVSNAIAATYSCVEFMCQDWQWVIRYLCMGTHVTIRDKEASDQICKRRSCRAGRAPVGLEIGTRRVAFQQLPDLAISLPWGRAIPAAEEGVVIHEIHQDCVLVLPKGAMLLASSPKTRVEAWAYQDFILCVQGEAPALMWLCKKDRA